MGHTLILALAWAILLVAQLPYSYQQQEPRTLHVANGQQLADAVADWGLAGGDLVIQVDSWYLSLENVTIRQVQAGYGQRAPFSSGKLKLVGQWDGKDNMTLFNTAMRQLAPPMSGATVLVQNIWTFNNCEDYVMFASPKGATWFRASYLSIFPWSFFYQSMTTNNTGTYARPSQLSSQCYLAALWRVPLYPIQRIMAPILTSIPVFKVRLTSLSRDTTVVDSFLSDQVAVYNTTAKSSASRNDRLLQQLHAQGLIMPPHFCNGTRLPAELAAAQFDPLTPAWLADDTDDLMKAMQEAVALTNSPKRRNDSEWMPVPFIGVLGNATLEREVGPVRWPLLLIGPLNDVPETAVTAVLDLQQGIDTIRLGPTGKLLIQQLILNGLGLRVLSSGLSSALPMAAISPPPGSNLLTDKAHVWMHNVTLMLPPNDFLALTSLALANTPGSIRDCVGPDVRALADQLQGGIRSMSVAGVDVANQWLVLSSFVGWGLNATSLKLVPERSLAPLDGCSRGSQETRCGRLRCGQLAGLLLGMVCMCSLIIGAAVLLVFRHKRQQGASKPRSSISLSAVNTPHNSVTFWNMLSGPAPQSHRSILDEHLADIDAQNNDQVNLPMFNDGSSEASGAASSGQRAASVDSRAHARHLVELKAMQLNSEADKVIITRIIGHGSSGTVFQGVWRGLTVALKTVVFEDIPGSAPDQAKSCRAVMEAAISASLSHPNIVATYRYDIKPVVAVPADGNDTLQVVMTSSSLAETTQPVTYKLFLMQEYCELNLSTIFDNKMLHHAVKQAVDWASLIQLLIDMTSGLAYLHANSIIHGDLKPCNVLIKWHPVHKTRVVAKLADFGLSNHLQGNATHVSNFQAGTPFYVAPEVAKLGRTSPASDIYSLGMIMWEAASGCSLCIQSSGGQAISNPLFPAFPDHIQPVPAYVELLRRCIANDPQLRPSASEVIKQLKVMMKQY